MRPSGSKVAAVIKMGPLITQPRSVDPAANSLPIVGSIIFKELKMIELTKINITEINRTVFLLTVMFLTSAILNPMTHVLVLLSITS
jgi:hypothetical protein